jgi:Trk K+ transport system NAD-binding subunit
MFRSRPQPRRLRKLLADIRDTVVLVRQFRGALFAFLGLVGLGGALYFELARRAGEARPASLTEGMYVALSLVFLQAPIEFPPHWYLQVFFFALPLLGLAILGQGVADLGVLLFNRQARGEAWQMAVAETFSNHIVLVGLGHLGFRIATALHNLGEAFICVEQNPEAELASQVQSWNVPIIRGDALKHDVLRKAGLERAHTVVLATSDDIMNLQIAIHARAVNPRVRTIVRLFDDDFAREVQNAFGITSAYSASALAAPTFAAAAADLDVVQSVTLGGRVLSMSRFTLTPESALTGLTIRKLEHDLDLSVVLLKRGAEADLHPADERALKAGDEVTIFADTATLHRLGRLNGA